MEKTWPWCQCHVISLKMLHTDIQHCCTLCVRCLKCTRRLNSSVLPPWCHLLTSSSWRGSSSVLLKTWSSRCVFKFLGLKSFEIFVLHYTIWRTGFVLCVSVDWCGYCWCRVWHIFFVFACIQKLFKNLFCQWRNEKVKRLIVLVRYVHPLPFPSSGSPSSWQPFYLYRAGVCWACLWNSWARAEV